MKNQAQGVAQKAAANDRESIRDFINIAVHDLREPLRAIRVGSHLLVNEDGRGSAENVERGARYVLEGVDRLEGLIHDIAEYCYEEERDPEIGEASLESALLEAQKELAGPLKTSGCAITHASLPTVSGDMASLTAVFRCLLDNACKFRRANPPHIHVAAARQDSEWVISVQDDGQGFDNNYSDRIFRPFERLNGKQFPGSGLGLTMARKIIERHGGRIWADGKLGEGAIFRFTLPVAS